MQLTGEVGPVRTLFSVVRGAPKAAAGFGILALIVLIAVLHGPILTLIGLGHAGNSEFGLRTPSPAPAWIAFLGPGRIELAELVLGLWNSLRIGIEAGLLSTAIGLAAAFYASYRGGVVDSILSTTTDLFLVIPAFPLLAVFAAYGSGTTVNAIAIVMAVFGWAVVARPIRSHVLSLRTRGFVDLARVSKASTAEIILTELLPNMLPFIAMGCAQAIMTALLAVIGLDVFGLGPADAPDLGSLVYRAIQGGALTLGDWQAVFVPMATIVLLFFSLGLIALGLEERFNPRLQKMVGR
ncbi:MAG: ABC transporter permease [Candidatus Dormibacteraeota bacterium]|nr:ABC transporter permease [Candidatus Dormibacteraeota bacterium]